ncbi:MAG: hypothetical protein IKK57_04405 [Clostridia bacterium]|nr:hypothetical protein [Clostridia bacterium]
MMRTSPEAENAENTEDAEDAEEAEDVNWIKNGRDMYTNAGNGDILFRRSRWA